MLSPANHPLEQKRLEALREYEVLDTEAEQCFDDYTQLAARLLNLPMAVISLVDEKRQWFKSTVGLDAKETPREISFCGHAILETEPVFIVEDASQDERFKDNPLVIGGPQIRFYAGAQLVTPEHFPVGTLCVIDSKPRKLSPTEQETLAVLARQLMAQLELRKANRILRENEKTILKQQAHLIDSQKMTALGRMAAGIAHEINNPLSIIRGRSEILLMAAESANPIEPKRIADSAEMIIKTVDRIGKIVKGMKGLTRSSSVDPFKETSVSEIMVDTLEFCKERCTSRGINISVDASEIPILLECRPEQIVQVLLNLIGNASDEIEGTPNSWIKIESCVTNDGVDLMVTDSGTGLTEAVRTQMFEPFFTTKEIGKGVGLGLFISTSIVESHGGTLSVDPKSKNTRFIIHLPKHQNLGQQNLSAS